MPDPTSDPGADRPSDREDGIAHGLIPRQRLPKIPSDQIQPVAGASGRLVVKFIDEVKARVRQDGRIRSDGTKNTAVISHYYRFEDAAGEKETGIESMFAMLEGAAAIVIGKLDRREAISKEEKEELSLFVGLQATRVPQFERHRIKVLLQQSPADGARVGFQILQLHLGHAHGFAGTLEFVQCMLKLLSVHDVVAEALAT